MIVIAVLMAELEATITKVVHVVIKKDGHQSDATLHNCKNGSNKWCDSE